MVQKNTINKEPDMFKRVKFKLRKGGNELGERKARESSCRGNSMCGGVQWASASMHQRTLDWNGLPNVLKGSLPFIPPGLPFIFRLHGHQAIQLETDWKFQ